MLGANVRKVPSRAGADFGRKFNGGRGEGWGLASGPFERQELESQRIALPAVGCGKQLARQLGFGGSFPRERHSRAFGYHKRQPCSIVDPIEQGSFCRIKWGKGACAPPMTKAGAHR